MARPAQDSRITLSVIDRLIDEEPREDADPPVTHSQALRKLKGAVRRDLEWLLNSRRIAEELPEAAETLRASVYCYGLPDINSLSYQSNLDRARLVKGIEEAVSYFEPRLMNVRVRLIESEFASSRALRFQIDGLLKMDPAPERVSFDTTLMTISGEYSVRGEGGA